MIFALGDVESKVWPDRRGKIQMRSFAAMALAMSVLLGADDASAQTALRASVDLSEWTPSQTLVLNLKTGSYVVTPPASGWPEAITKPLKRRGRLTGESLRMTRTLAEQALKSGVTDKQCEAGKSADDDIVISNAVGPMTLTLIDTSLTQTSLQTKCRTEAAHVLVNYITRLFDHRSP